MMSDTSDIPWEDVADAAEKMFGVWFCGGEFEWAKEAWGHFQNDGLASEATFLERTAAFVRLVALAKIYEKFCGLAWDENPGTPLSDLAEDLDIDPVALGILAATNNTEQFDDAEDRCGLEGAALVAATKKCRPEIYSCLRGAYGSDVGLYARMYRTRNGELSEDDEADVEDECDAFEPTGRKCAAFEFVMNGFIN